MHEGKKFYIDVLETKTAAAIRVNDTDCEVDFALPLDYKEPEKVKLADKLIEKASMEAGKKEKQVVVADDEEPKFRPFMGVPCSKVTSVVGRKAGKVVFGSSNAAGKLLEELKKVDDKRRIMGKKKEENGGFQAFTRKSYRLGTE
nr:ubiquitin fusion degradation protein 1 homolog [Ziziphus jujuba var. spinosa]